MPCDEEYLSLAPNVSIRRLETGFLYRADTDDLYEVSDEALVFLKRCDGTRTAASLAPDKDFLGYCLSEGLLVASASPSPAPVPIGACEAPSLRYLVVDVTNRCNFHCRHCYLDRTEPPADLDPAVLASLFDEFEKMGGIRLIVSGGEPMCAPEFWTINDLVAGRPFRSILSTNGSLIDPRQARRLSFHNVQVSLDGMRPGHERLRGPGTFDGALRALESLAEAGVRSSVATMVHAANVGEFEEMARLAKRLGVTSWTIDVPVAAGALLANPELSAPLDVALGCLDYQFGAEMHGSSGDYACGAHLAAVTVHGTLAKCGFYSDWTGGRIGEGLRTCWERLPKMRLGELECDCGVIEQCRGGCRFRAEAATGSRLAPDEVRCRACDVSSANG